MAADPRLGGEAGEEAAADEAAAAKKAKSKKKKTKDAPSTAESAKV